MIIKEGTDLNVGDDVQEQEYLRRQAVIQRQMTGSCRDVEKRMWVLCEKEEREMKDKEKG